MSSLIETYLIPAATFILGILVKFAFDSFANKQEYNRKRNDDVRKNRREVYLDFLLSIENVLISGSEPSAEAIEQSKKKLVAVELDGSEHVILFARILLMRLEAQSNGIESSHDKFIPTFRKYFLELARAELANHEPDVKHLEQELLQDPFIAMLSGVPTEPKPTGTVEVLFEIGKKRPTNIKQPKS